MNPLAKITRGQTRGYVAKKTAGMAKLRVSYTVKTSMNCSCWESNCTSRIQIFRYGAAWDGSRRCPHCKEVKKNGGFFTGESDLTRQLKNINFREAPRTFIRERSERDMLGVHLRHQVRNASFRV